MHWAATCHHSHGLSDETAYKCVVVGVLDRALSFPAKKDLALPKEKAM